MSDVKIPLKFEIYKGEQLLETKTLEQNIIKIGKLQSSHLRIEDENVSRMHAVIEVTGPDQIFIIDLGSTKGTIVNGQKVNKCKLQSGDEIVLGGTKVVVTIEEKEEEEPAAAPSDDTKVDVAAPAAAAAAAAAPGAPTRPAPSVPSAPAAPRPPAGGAPLARPVAAAAPARPAASWQPIAINPAEFEDTSSPGALEVMALWDGTPQDVRLLRESGTEYFVGEDPTVDWVLPLEDVPNPKWPLVHSAKGGDFYLSFTDKSTGEMVLNDEVTSFEELKQQGRASGAPHGGFMFAIPNGARCKVAFGRTSFLVNSVFQPVAVATRPPFAWGSQLYTAISAAAHAMFLILVFSMPPEARSLSLDAFNADNRFVKYLMKPPEKVEEKIPSWLKSKKKSLDDAGGKGKRHKGEEGKMGSKTSKAKTGLYGIKGPPDNKDVHLAKRLADEAVKNAGFLGIFKETSGSHIASEFGRDTALGTDEVNALGGLIGDKIGEAAGEGGLGLYGTGRGGGGIGEGTIGLDYGGPDTIGKGGGGGSGSGYGRGAGHWGGHKATAPDVVAGAPIIRGSLSKEIIRRVIRKHKPEIKYCYEKELSKKPELYGKVKINFVIAPTGAVAKANVAESTLKNASVESCLTGKVLRFIFPKPEGGGIVEVAYPFVFNNPAAEAK